MTMFYPIYLGAAILILSVLFAVIVMILKSENYYKWSLIYPITAGIFGVPVYCAFIISRNHFSAMLFDSLYFVSTDYITLYMLNLVFDLTGKQDKKKIPMKIFNVLTIIDAISQMLNCVFNHTFDLKWKVLESGFGFWSLELYWTHYIHLGLCYVFVIATFILLVQGIIKSPMMYKKRYVAILVAYFVSIVTNMFCYSMDTPIDFSVLLYAVMACFISFFTAYMVPKQLITDSLNNFHATIDDSIICFDINDQYLFANENAEKLFEREGKFSKETAENFRREWVQNREMAENSFSSDEIFFIDKKEFHFSVEYQELKEDGKKIGSYFKLQDRTDEINRLFKEHYVATHDALTGIYNREYFLKMCDEKLKSDPDAKRIMIASNIKNFSLINELFGVRKGDEVLCVQADRMRSLAHRDNVYGRIINDKFAILMREEDFVPSIFINEIKLLGKNVSSSNYSLRIHMGIYRVEDSTESAAIIYDKALMALDAITDDYQQVLNYYDKTLMDRLLAEKFIISEFEKAISENQFQIYIQPIFDDKDAVVGGEVKVHWHNQEKGHIMPDYFIPTLEKTGLMYKLDLFVWEKAICTIKEWQLRGIKNKYISINISSKDFYYIDVENEILLLVEKYGIKHESLIVEISEDLISAEFEKVSLMIQHFHDAGVRVSIDNFGQGISSLNLLQLLKADIIKVDTLSLRDRDNIEKSNTIFKFVVEMAKQLNMYVIGKGLDRDEQYEDLKRIGYRYFQSDDIGVSLIKKDFEKKYLNFEK